MSDETKGRFKRTCPVCEQDFETNNAKQVYCSCSCRRKRQNRLNYVRRCERQDNE